jgi:hypothetical protein
VLKEDMGRRYRVFRRFLKRKALVYYLTLALAGLVGVSTFTPDIKHKYESQGAPVETSGASAAVPLSFQFLPNYPNREPSHRTVYPYSIIPGGISSVKELKNAIALDPLVKTHYQGFNLAKAHIVRLTKDRAVHVSYRRGGGIYWTTKKVILFRGETLITDGKSASRTRCGNRISDRPVTPSSPDEPPPAVFDEPVLSPPAAPLVPPYGSPVPPPEGPVPIPPFISIFRGGDSPLPIGNEPDNPTPVPEPDTLYLLIVSLPFARLIRKKRGS